MSFPLIPPYDSYAARGDGTAIHAADPAEEGPQTLPGRAPQQTARPKENKENNQATIVVPPSGSGIYSYLERLPSLSILPARLYWDLLVISEIYRRQPAMYESKISRTGERIISIFQSHIRPIKRGKVTADTEFGAKVSIRLGGGYVFTERIGWSSFNEGVDLVESI